jgi:hypothetical protein
MSDPFGSCLESLGCFINEMQPSFIETVDWVLDQCGWCYLSNAEWCILEQHYDYHNNY